MRCFRSSISIGIGLLLTAFLTHAQEDVLRPQRPATLDQRTMLPVAIGIEMGMNFSFFSQNLQWFYDATGFSPSDPRFSVLESGNGITPFISAVLDIGLTSQWGLQFKVGYDIKNVSNKETGPVPCILRDPYGYPIADTITRVQSDYTLKLSYLHLTPLLRFRPLPKLSFAFGPTLHFATGTAEIHRKDTIVSTEGCLFYPNPFDFTNGTRSLEQTGSLDTLIISPRFGIEMNVGYYLALIPHLWLVPSVQFQLFFHNVTREERNLQVEDQQGNPIILDSDYRNTLHSIRFALQLLIDL